MCLRSRSELGKGTQNYLLHQITRNILRPFPPDHLAVGVASHKQGPDLPAIIKGGDAYLGFDFRLPAVA